MYACICNAIREETVRELGRCGVTESAEIANALGLDQPDVCGRCIRSLDRFVELACDGGGADQRVMVKISSGHQQ